MTKKDMAKKLVENGYATSQKAALEMLNFIFDDISKTAASGEKVSIFGFGTFERKVRNGKTGVANGHEYTTATKYYPAVKFSATVKTLFAETYKAENAPKKGKKGKKK